MDVIASEWMKIRTVRSTYYLLAAVAVVLVLGSVVSWLMVADFDTSPPERQALFASADTSVLVTPFTQFCVAALGALVVTSEYGNGMIRTVLVAVPDRRSLLLGKATAVGACALVIGVTTSFTSFASSRLIMGDRPPPVAPWASMSDALPSVFASAASVTAAGLVGFGLGLVLRSTVGTVVSICALLWLLPSLTPLLPEPWSERISSAMLPYLVPQLAGSIPDAPLSPVGAAAAMAVYVVAALGAGGLALIRRDA